MKTFRPIKFLLILVLGASFFTACDEFDDDISPARMSNLAVNDDQATTRKNQGVHINVLANDTIGGQATVQFSQPSHGILHPDSSTFGGLYYMPAPNYIGIDSFTYKVCMGTECANATVTITITPDSINVPTCTVKAINDAATVKENKSVTVNILQNDSLCNNQPAIAISLAPRFGQAYLNGNNQVVYNPAANYKGHDLLNYTLSGSNGTSTATLYISVQPDSVIQPPCTIQAVSDTVSMIHRVQYTDSVSINVLANDKVCMNGSTVIPSITVQPQLGSLTAVGSGPSFRYMYTTSAPVTNTSDSFRYQICQTISGRQVCSDTYVIIILKP